MHWVKNIVVGVDRSQASRQALREASRIAVREGARLHILEVIPDGVLEVYWAGVGETPEETRRLYLAELVDLVEGLVEPEVDREIDNIRGHPYRELIAKVEAVGADLLVIGAQGWSSHGEEVGTFAVECVRRCPVATLVVRRDQDHPFSSVAACLDLSDAGSGPVLGAAEEIACQDGAELHLLHVLALSWLKDPAVGFYAEMGDLVEKARAEEERLARSRLDWLLTRLPELPDRIHTKVVRHQQAARGIVDSLLEDGIELAVLADRGRGGFRSLLLGSTAERVVRDAHCSVLVLRSRAEPAPLPASPS